MSKCLIALKALQALFATREKLTLFLFGLRPSYQSIRSGIGWVVHIISFFNG